MGEISTSTPPTTLKFEYPETASWLQLYQDAWKFMTKEGPLYLAYTNFKTSRLGPDMSCVRANRIAMNEPNHEVAHNVTYYDRTAEKTMSLTKVYRAISSEGYTTKNILISTVPREGNNIYAVAYAGLECAILRDDGNSNELGCQTEMTAADIQSLEQEVTRLSEEVYALRKKVEDGRFTAESFRRDDEKHSSQNSLGKFEEMMVFLMRLRLYLSVQDLAYRFRISASTVSRVFEKWLNVFYDRLSPLIRWPTSDQLAKTMPTVFRENFSTKTHWECVAEAVAGGGAASTPGNSIVLRGQDAHLGLS
ncbi:hypothetical protein ISCGN_009857 [Ixodes scapularis]